MEELQLNPDSEETKDAISKLGRLYNLVTSTTSLIVLETLEQYLKYKIEPPITLTDVSNYYQLLLLLDRYMSNIRK
jgi:hypothetical protein